MVAERDLGLANDAPAPSRTSRWGPHWPLSVMALGFPLWWALGLRTLLPMAMAVVMADHLLRRKRVTLPRGFALWVMFLGWVLLGVLVLWADAPGAVPGGGASRLLVFGYRAAWYLTATLAMLWVANLKQSELSTRWLFQLLAFLFLVTVAGGLLGVLVPTLEFRSPLEMLLPSGIRGNSLVESIAHPEAADVQNVLGRPEARPKAPFPFANSWGSAFALLLPFFLVAWLRDGRRWQRLAAPVILLAAAVPVVYSLNRGLWACLALGAVGYLVLQARKRRVAPLLATVVLLVALGAAFAVSPLGTMFSERLAHAHSNERRGELMSQTVSSMVTGSPVVGFGSTRDVQGSFASIAGAATPDCRACGVPPLGTQGHLWLVMFTQGLVGTALFLAFFGYAFTRCWRCRTTTETLCTFVLVFFGLQLLIYDTLGIPLVVVMLAIGAVWREQRSLGRHSAAAYDARAAVSRLREVAPFLAACAVVGTCLGGSVAALTPTRYVAKASILLTEPPVHLDPQGLADPTAATSEVTVDTEAALTVSRQSLRRVAGTTDPAALEELRNRIRVTAPPNTRILEVAVRDGSPERARSMAVRVARSYLETRREFLLARRDQVLTELQEQLVQLDTAAAGSVVAGSDAPRLSARGLREARDRTQTALSRLNFTPTSAGEVVKTGLASKVRRQAEVPVTSGAGLGLAVGSLLVAGRPGWRPGVPRLRRRRRS